MVGTVRPRTLLALTIWLALIGLAKLTGAM
jgi:hypothetical protein